MNTQTKQKSKWKAWHVIVLVIVAGLFIVIKGMTSSADASAETLRLSDPIERRLDSVKLAFSEWDGSQKKLVEYVKQSMNDPKSFEHVNTKFWDMQQKITVVMEYSGKNAFGGVVSESIKVETDLAGNITKVFPK